MEYLNEDILKNEILKLQARNRLLELYELGVTNTEEVLKLQNKYKVDRNYRNTRFGEMVNEIVINLAKKSNFVGYSNNWKDEMKSNAIEKIMGYSINNFNAKLFSSRTNEPVKAFAYITQIANNAFIEVINKMKKHQESLENTIDYNEIPYETSYSSRNKIRNLEYSNKKFKDWIKSEKDTIDSCPRGYVCKEINGLLYIMVGRDKDILIEDDSLKDGMYVILNSENEIIDKDIFIDVYSIIKKYINISFTYPLNYLLTKEEFLKINSIDSKFKKIQKYSDIYIPKFPKRKKTVKKSVFEDWED